MMWTPPIETKLNQNSEDRQNYQRFLLAPKVMLHQLWCTSKQIMNHEKKFEAKKLNNQQWQSLSLARSV